MKLHELQPLNEIGNSHSFTAPIWKQNTSNGDHRWFGDVSDKNGTKYKIILAPVRPEIPYDTSKPMNDKHNLGIRHLNSLSIFDIGFVIIDPGDGTTSDELTNMGNAVQVLSIIINETVAHITKQFDKLPDILTATIKIKHNDDGSLSKETIQRTSIYQKILNKELNKIGYTNSYKLMKMDVTAQSIAYSQDKSNLHPLVISYLANHASKFVI